MKEFYNIVNSRYSNFKLYLYKNIALCKFTIYF